MFLFSVNKNTFPSVTRVSFEKTCLQDRDPCSYQQCSPVRWKTGSTIPRDIR